MSPPEQRSGCIHLFVLEGWQEVLQFGRSQSTVRLQRLAKLTVEALAPEAHRPGCWVSSRYDSDFFVRGLELLAGTPGALPGLLDGRGSDAEFEAPAKVRIRTLVGDRSRHRTQGGLFKDSLHALPRDYASVGSPRALCQAEAVDLGPGGARSAGKTDGKEGTEGAERTARPSGRVTPGRLTPLSATQRATVNSCCRLSTPQDPAMTARPAAPTRTPRTSTTVRDPPMDPLGRAFYAVLLDQSTRDPLTGLNNRRSTLEELQNRFDLSLLSHSLTDTAKLISIIIGF